MNDTEETLVKFVRLSRLGPIRCTDEDWDWMSQVCLQVRDMPINKPQLAKERDEAIRLYMASLPSDIPLTEQQAALMLGAEEAEGEAWTPSSSNSTTRHHVARDGHG